MEYNLEYEIIFQCDNKNLEKISELRTLGSSITSMELCMVLEDRLNELKLNDEKIKKISYNFNRDDFITLIIHVISLKRLTKDYQLELRDKFLEIINNEFNINRIHVFRDKNQELKEVYLRLFLK